MKTYKSPEEYLLHQSEVARKMLLILKSIIHKAAPEAELVISYGIIGFKQKSMLVYMGGFAKHIGFYPGASPIAHFKSELKDYNCSKGTVQFPLGSDLPVKLITRMVKFRITELSKKKKK